MENTSNHAAGGLKTALVLGGSGLIGGHLLDLLLTDERYGKVISLGRKALPRSHAKLEQHVVDLLNLEHHASYFTDVDDVFIAIGTTQAKTPNKTQYEAIDFGIPVAAGKLAQAARCKNVAVVSSMGANAASKVFYSALKGRMEDALRALNLPNLVVVRPSLLLGHRTEQRHAEKIAMQVMQGLKFIIPAKCKAIPAQKVARAMVVLVNSPKQKEVWCNDALLALVPD